MDHAISGVDGLARGDYWAYQWDHVSGAAAGGECCWVGDCVVVYFGHATHHPRGTDDHVDHARQWAVECRVHCAGQ